MERATRPIADYGLIGDTRTAALVASDGSIDWMCIPHFDRDPVFGCLVGGSEAGSFRIAPDSHYDVLARRYRPDTATLETTWAVGTSRVTLTEGMVADLGGHLLPASLLVRQVRVEGPPVPMRVEFDPRLGVDHRRPVVRTQSAGRVVCAWGACAVALDASEPVALL